MKSIKLLFSIFFLVILQLLEFIKNIFFINNSDKILVLYYHSVGEEDVQRFRWQIEKLLKLGKVVHADFNTSIKSKRVFAITFDDGFISILKNVLPIIKSFSIPITIFFPTGYIGKAPGWEIRGEKYDPKEIVLNKDQILELDKNLVRVGSHSVTHPNFLLISPERQLSELVESRQALNLLIKENIDSFSFPYGAYDMKLINLAHESGYKFIFNTLPSFSRISKNKDFHLRGRVPVNCSDSKIEFLVKILGGYNWLSGYIRLKKIIKLN